MSASRLGVDDICDRPSQTFGVGARFVGRRVTFALVATMAPSTYSVPPVGPSTTATWVQTPTGRAAVPCRNCSPDMPLVVMVNRTGPFDHWAARDIVRWLLAPKSKTFE